MRLLNSWMLPISNSAVDRFPNVAKPWPAWLLSVALHAVLLAICAVLLFQYRGGAGEVENRTGGIVLVDAVSETTEYLSEGEVTDAAAQSQLQPQATAIADELPPELPGLAAADSPLTGVSNDLVESLTGADSLITGQSSNNRPIGGKVTTEVFGVKGTGSTFVYVFDRSASMEDLGGRPLRAAKKQLLESLASLGENQRFQIIFYNDQISIFQTRPGESVLAQADETNRTLAESFVASIRGQRGTDHLRALQKALSFGPDVVFLLTDAEGGFTTRELSRIAEWNRSGAVINAIEFGSGRRSGDASLKRVAAESRGQYIYKDVQAFRD